jgi:hypothetical protein
MADVRLSAARPSSLRREKSDDSPPMMRKIGQGWPR